ncbi:MAG: hypothetical protein KAS32_25970 [Candidatus Peribacteraceae bacterium]|nr:hypothetical protein [Candidatus Peribacteraceae bacterium]
MAVTLSQVNDAIADLVTNPQTDYKIGQKTVKAGQIMDQLIRLRKSLVDVPDSPTAVFMTFDANDIGIFGENNNQYQK